MCRQLLLEAGALLSRRVVLALARGQLPLEFLAAKGSCASSSPDWAAGAAAVS